MTHDFLWGIFSHRSILLLLHISGRPSLLKIIEFFELKVPSFAIHIVLLLIKYNGSLTCV